jgi:DNA-binding transcriptional ArsR family regulator
MTIESPSLPAPRSLDLKFAALADPTRRAILARLAQGEATVSDLRKPFQISQPAISKHLKVLETAGLIERGRAAQSRPRRLNVEALKETSEWVEQIRGLWSDSLDRLETLLDTLQQPKG